MPTVLFVDDDLDHQELFTRILRVGGFRVLTAGDAGSAVNLIDRHRVDAAVLDVRLPGTTGIELCRWLRQRPSADGLAILLLSADSTGGNIRAALEAGADDFLIKPIGRVDLLARLGEVIACRSRGVAPAAAALLAARAITPGPAALAAAVSTPAPLAVPAA